MLKLRKKDINKHKILLFPLIFILILFSCKVKNIPPENNNIFNRIVILYTNDEHGWMEATDTHGGAAGMMGLWKSNEGYTEDGHFLILSGGDTWTGPAISTWTRGESMIEVMKTMDYDAAAIGNHEFDFGIDTLNQRIIQANFPFLSANIREKGTGVIPSFVTPYVVKQVNGIRVGLIGLTTTTTPLSTFPDHVKDLDFISYDDALREIVPQVIGDGAELLIVVGHICYSEILELLQTAADLGIDVIGGGHCHQLFAENQNGVAIVQADSNMMFYAKIDISFDTNTDTVRSMNISTHENIGAAPDTEVEAVVSYWQNEVNQTLSRVIGYAAQDIPTNSPAMFNMVTDSWLFSFPSSEISLINVGAVRQSIPAGDITLGTIVSVLPFEDYLFEVELSGAQLVECISDLVMGGMTTIDGYQLSDGTPIDPGTTYKVLTLDYLYSRSDYCFQYYDVDPYHTSVHYRQPVIDWITSLNTSAANPLDNYLDHTARK
ncbi:MAG: bifunctional UDP-sugar hydrolase/5'-nucleotidase [Candidatus Aminicenantes bacterium]|jgi:2',3'-cyclic-nucleotide 2'-phosphodiesterase (5'-nucleotidase family)